MTSERDARAIASPSGAHGRSRALQRGDQLGQKLAQGLNLLGLPLDGAQQDLLLRYLALLLRWNGVYNLTSVRDPADMVTLHLLDSLSVAALIRGAKGAEVLDVGTGAGLPGIPLAIACPSYRFRLVDAVAKKISFLRQVKASLSLVNIEPQHVRVEALTLATRPDVIVSRAYADLTTMVRSIDHLADGSTAVIAMKGAAPRDEIASLPASWRVDEVRELDVPFLGAQRCAVVLRRAADTTYHKGL
jgi:16S rRNA (guanine527-N7)-methyltransferase